jgi:NAD(P)H-hydrate epimerase
MEHAAAGAAALAAHLAGARGRVLVACGPGNNGGDGYGVARFLASWGFPVRVARLAPAPPRLPDAAREARWAAADVAVEDAWARPEAVREAARDADLLVDAVFGTGPARVDGPYPGWFEALNEAPLLRLALDVPSGLDAETGTVPGAAIRADVTATFGLPKRGLLPPDPGAAYAGRVVEVDIGLPAALHRDWIVAP